MKRLIIAAMFLILLISKPVQAIGSVDVHAVYLPIVSVPYSFSIDCVDSNGRLTGCK